MDEFWRWLGGGIGISLFGWMAKKFFEKNIEEAIKEAKAVALEAKKVSEEARDKISGAAFKLAETQQELSTTISREMTNMSTVFSEATRFTANAMTQAHRSEMAVKDLSKKTEEDMKKLAQGGHILNDKIEKTRSEVLKISEDLLLIKGKK